MKLTFVRHGEMTGDPFACPPSPVTGCLSEDIGVLQAEATAKALRNERYDIAYSSPFGRALQTAEIVLASRGLDIKVLPYMHEWMPRPEYRTLPNDEWEALMHSQSGRYAEQGWMPGIGEGVLDMHARIIPPFLEELDRIGIHPRYGGYVPEDDAKDLSIILFAHGGSLGVLTSFLLGLRVFPEGGFSFEHTGVARIVFSQKNGVYYPKLVIPALHAIERRGE